MKQADRWRILESAPVADADTCSEHFTAFVNVFVKKEHRDRWLHLLLKRPGQTYKQSSKLEEHLDRLRCELVDDVSRTEDRSMGVYYGFLDKPVLISIADARIVGKNQDAVFSIHPGKLALYFCHEGHMWLCKA